MNRIQMKALAKVNLGLDVIRRREDGYHEVKMIISLDTSVFKSLEIPVVNDVHEEPLDFEKIEAMPGITGHVVSEGDSIWNLAKRYYASPEDIRELNDLKGDELLAGQPLLIMKNMEILK